MFIANVGVASATFKTDRGKVFKEDVDIVPTIIDKSLSCMLEKLGLMQNKRCEPYMIHIVCLSGRRDSDPRPSAWEADALPTELLPQFHLAPCCYMTTRRIFSYFRRRHRG